MLSLIDYYYIPFLPLPPRALKGVRGIYPFNYYLIPKGVRDIYMLWVSFMLRP